jgi:hypothetical protein
MTQRIVFGILKRVNIMAIHSCFYKGLQSKIKISSFSNLSITPVCPFCITFAGIQYAVIFSEYYYKCRSLVI